MKKSVDKIPVFDIGDTLIPCYRLQEKLFRDIARENGVEQPDFVKPNLKIYNVPEVDRYLKENNLEADAGKVIERYEKREEQFLRSNGVFSFLRECSKNYGEIGFISDNSIKGKNWFRKLLEHEKVSYKGFTVSEEVGVEKPNPKIFKEFLKEREESAEQFVYFGNNVKRDRAAEKAGMNFVWVKGYNTFNTSYSGVSIIKPSIESIETAFEKLERVEKKV